MTHRLAQISLVAACALYMLLVLFNNLTDYSSNYQLVEHVLGMDTTFSGNSGLWRAIHRPVVYHIFYASIIAWEATSGALLTLGAGRLWQARSFSTSRWLPAKKWAVAGLTVGLLLWLVAFITVGGEWFLMWQSGKWNGLGPATRMFTVMGFVLLYLHQAEAAS
jgi:predicted small integral membrane protein